MDNGEIVYIDRLVEHYRFGGPGGMEAGQDGSRYFCCPGRTLAEHDLIDLRDALWSCAPRSTILAELRVHGICPQRTFNEKWILAAVFGPDKGIAACAQMLALFYEEAVQDCGEEYWSLSGTELQLQAWGCVVGWRQAFDRMLAAGGMADYMRSLLAFLHGFDFEEQVLCVMDTLGGGKLTSLEVPDYCLGDEALAELKSFVWGLLPDDQLQSGLSLRNNHLENELPDDWFWQIVFGTSDSLGYCAAIMAEFWEQHHSDWSSMRSGVPPEFTFKRAWDLLGKWRHAVMIALASPAARWQVRNPRFLFPARGGSLVEWSYMLS